MDVFQAENLITQVVIFVLLAVKIYAFGSSLLFSGEAYDAAGKLTKPAWCIILGLGVALQLMSVGGLTLILVSTIAAFVYILDVRPALASLTRR